jgi:demethylmenaquinone methyltransferase/2-methoxy-6-polyprenyl-1,4-benzoquinol methylase
MVKKKEVIDSSYNIDSDSYDLRYFDEQNEKYQIVTESIRFNKDETILDVGCGTGLYIKNLIDLKKISRNIIGIDISKQMLDKSVRRCKSYEDAYFIRGDAHNLPFRKDSFDKVFAFTVIQNLSNPIDALREFIRVAKDSSSIVVTTHKKTCTEKKFVEMIEKTYLNCQIIENKTKDHIAKCYKNTE